jgi:hypothetical protein
MKEEIGKQADPERTTVGRTARAAQSVYSNGPNCQSLIFAERRRCWLRAGEVEETAGTQSADDG